MTTSPPISAETAITILHGSAGYVKRKLNKIPEENGIKIIAIIFFNSEDLPISKIARAFKKSTSVQRLLSGKAEYELYQSLIAASVPKKFPKPKLLIQAEMLASTKK